jgi:YfiH family protein
MLRDDNGLAPLLRFERFPNGRIVHGVSTRLGGVSEPPFASANHSLRVGDDPERVRENCRRFAGALGFPLERMVMARQNHGVEIHVVSAAPSAAPDNGAGPKVGLEGERLVTAEPATPLSPGDSLPLVDIQMTGQPGWLLSLRFADCVPVLIADPTRDAVAVVHAGWRGTARRAVAVAVGELQQRYGAEPANLWVGIGPAIGPCCYEVGAEVAAEFSELQGVVSQRSGGRPHLDLWEANRQIAQSSGVPGEQIETAALCTRCHRDLFFSHRAEGFPAGRFSAAVGIRP